MKDYFFILFLSLAVVAGCESKTEVSNLQTGEENSSDSVVDQAADQETSDGQSEKVAATEMPEADASPDQVCRIFMNLLRDENTESANRLFTRKARVLTMQMTCRLLFPANRTIDSVLAMRNLRPQKKNWLRSFVKLKVRMIRIRAQKLAGC